MRAQLAATRNPWSLGILARQAGSGGRTGRLRSAARGYGRFPTTEPRICESLPEPPIALPQLTATRW